MQDITIHRHIASNQRPFFQGEAVFHTHRDPFLLVYTITPDAPELRTILKAMLCWSISRLAEFAVARRGYGNSDIGCGLSYPEGCGDDEDPISAGSVNVYAAWGTPGGEEYEVSEVLYLQVLALYLALHGRWEEAERVQGLSESARVT